MKQHVARPRRSRNEFLPNVTAKEKFIQTDLLYRCTFSVQAVRNSKTRLAQQVRKKHNHHFIEKLISVPISGLSKNKPDKMNTNNMALTMKHFGLKKIKQIKIKIKLLLKKI